MRFLFCLLYTTTEILFSYWKLHLNYHLQMQNYVAMVGSGASQIKKLCDSCRRYLDHLDGKNKILILQDGRHYLEDLVAFYRLILPIDSSMCWSIPCSVISDKIYFLQSMHAILVMLLLYANKMFEAYLLDIQMFVNNFHTWNTIVGLYWNSSALVQNNHISTIIENLNYTRFKKAN
jgi:hypothetical protein